MTRFSQELMDTICEQLSQGKSLREICRADGMPHPSNVIRWAVEDREGCAQQYARAREIGYSLLAEELTEIADDGSNDWITRAYENGDVQQIPDHEHVTRSRLRVDTRKWLLSKMLPKVYGDKITQEHTGGGGGPLTLQIVRYADTEAADESAT